MNYLGFKHRLFGNGIKEFKKESHVNISVRWILVLTDPECSFTWSSWMDSDSLALSPISWNTKAYSPTMEKLSHHQHHILAYNYSNWSKYEIQAHNKSKKHIPTHRGESMCWRLWGVHCANIGWWDGWFSEMRTLEKLVHLVQINLPQSTYGPFKFLPRQWADKLTEGEDDHKTLLNNVLTEPNLRLDRSTEGSVLVLRGAVVCLGGWVVVLGGGIVIVVLVGLNVAVGKEKRGGWCLGAVQQVRDRR